MSAVVQEAEITVKRKTVRFTIDFDVEQHKFLKRWCLENSVQASLATRALVYTLEISEDVANAVLDVIFDESEEEPAIKTKGKTIRFTIDFDFEQHRFLKLFSLESGVQASLVIRALVKLLKESEVLENTVIEEIFGESEYQD